MVPRLRGNDAAAGLQALELVPNAGFRLSNSFLPFEEQSAEAFPIGRGE
jgi:hypothetical protein